MLIVVLHNTTNGQVFNIISVDGKNSQIHISTDDEHGALLVSCLKDTIHIEDLVNIIETTLLKKNFLKIVYGTRGGSGIHIENTMIITVNHQKLLQSLHVMSLFHEEFIDYSKPVDTSDQVEIRSTYKLRFALTGDTAQNYKLNVKVHDERKTKHHPRTNYSRNDLVVLTFDANDGIFCNTDKNISQYFTVFDPKSQKEIKQYIKGMFPIAKLGKYEYYYIKSSWYEKYDGRLSKYSY